MLNWFLNLSLGRKQIFALLIASLTPMIVVTIIALKVASNEVRDQAFDQLQAVKKNKARAVERYFHKVEGQIITMSAREKTISAMQDMKKSFRSLSSESLASPKEFKDVQLSVFDFYKQQFGKKYASENPNLNTDIESLAQGLDLETTIAQYRYISNNKNVLGEKHLLEYAEGSSSYHQDHQKYHPEIRHFLETFGYYDIFLVDPETGKIIYSVFKELDYATSLFDGPYKNTNFAEAFREALSLKKGEIILKDFRSYTPSYEAPASFIASPIYADEKLEGVLVFQMPLETINDIMGERTGMGETGESYLVGDDFLMRSDSYQDKEQRSVVSSFRTPEAGSVNTEASRNAINGIEGSAVIESYQGSEVLSAYDTLDIDHFTWGIIAEIEASEAFAGLSSLRWTIIIIMLVATIAIILLAISLSRLISKPIIDLSNAIQTIEKNGDFSLRLNNNRKDEIGQTSQALNSFLNNLSNAISETNLVLESLSRGQHSHSADENFPGQLGHLAEGANLASSKIRDAKNEQEKQAKSARESAEKANALAIEASQKAKETQVVKQALDSSATPALIADENLNIVYFNKAVGDLMQKLNTSLSGSGIYIDTNDLSKNSITSFPLEASQNDHLLANGQFFNETIHIGESVLKVSTSPIMETNGSFLGAVLEWEDLTAQLETQEKERKIAEENTRIRQALDVSNTSVMITDAASNIIYTNHALNNLILQSRSELKNQFGDFNENNLTGLKAEHFNDQPNEYRKQLDQLQNTLSQEIIAGTRVVSTSANPIFDSEHKRIGTVIEWMDRSEEVATENEIDKLIEAAAAGDFSNKINTGDKTGFFLNLGTGLNRLLETTNIALDDVIQVMTSLADGDLSRRIERNYEGEFGELKQKTNETIDRLTHILSEIREGSASISNGAQEITQGIADLKNRTEDQASSLETTASSMEEMTHMLKNSEENAKSANDAAQKSVDIARQGNESVSQISAAMSEISHSSEEISNIIGVIDEIAFQTNLLALNAAVEAARAGEQGRGFAVVAAEVRQLAQRSASAAKEIKELINDSVGKVNEGSRLVSTSGETLRSIVHEIEQVGGYMKEIFAGAREQSDGVEQVSKAVTQMDQITQQNAALAEQASAATENLAGQTQNLDKQLSFFKN